MSQKINGKKFQSLIGGVSVTEEEKEKNLNAIKEAIIKNNQGEEPTKISNEIFAKSYPESLELVKEYYDSLYYTKVAHITVWDGQKYINKNKEAASYRTSIKRDMLDTLVIFAPELIGKEIIEIKRKFNISTNEVAALLNNYKKIMEHVKKIKDLGEKQEKYHVAKTFYEEIVINGMTKQEFCNQYKISINSLDKHVELLKGIDERIYQEVKDTLGGNSTKRYYGLKELILEMGKYCKNKIQVDTPTGVIEMPFTMLDYYSMTNSSPDKLIDFINNPRNFNLNINTNDEIMYKNCIRKFLYANKNIGGFASKEFILKNHMAIGTSNNMVEMNEEICDELFDLFERERIPKYKKLIEKAFYRYALGKPILPLRLIETEKNLEEETHLTKTLKP